jgi:hypothetical protein
MWTPFIRKIFKILLLVLLILLTLLFFSCEKEPITPGNYQSGTPTEDSNDWVNDYTHRGTLPDWPTNFSNQNELVGTTWVLTRMTNGYATTFPNDTIRFVTNTNYTLNNGAIRPYQLSSGVSTTNKTLSLYYFQPFGGSHYSGQVGYYFVDDGEINQAEFHNIQNSTNTIQAWFIKL